MPFRVFVGLVFALNLVLANVCVMGTAFAATESPQQVLSREVPMSFNVVTCTWVKTETGWEPTADSPCASGHCLKQEKPDTRYISSNVVEVPAAQIPVITLSPVIAEPIRIVAKVISASPPPYPGHRSTVQRM